MRKVSSAIEQFEWLIQKAKKRLNVDALNRIREEMQDSENRENLLRRMNSLNLESKFLSNFFIDSKESIILFLLKLETFSSPIEVIIDNSFSNALILFEITCLDTNNLAAS